MGLMNEFKQFALRGNVVDLAVGLILGAGFGKIVSSLVDNIIMPPIGLIIGGVDFTDLSVKLSSPIGDAKPVLIEYGKFIQSAVDFTIVAFAVFLLVKLMNRMKVQDALAPVVAPTRDQVLLEEIRDSLNALKAK